MVIQAENKNGDRALVDMNEKGFVFIVNPQQCKGGHAKPQPTLVHYVSTLDAVMEGLAQLTGTVWRLI